MSDRERRQRSKEFGIKLGKLLQDRAVQTRAEHDLDPRYVMLGAAEYLQETAEFQITLRSTCRMRTPSIGGTKDLFIINVVV